MAFLKETPFKGYYADPSGHIYSSWNTAGKITDRRRLLKTTITDKGYCRVWMAGSMKAVHRIILMTFCRMPRSFEEANHKNGIKTDNRLDNLEWMTRSMNEIHAYKMGLKSKAGENHHGNKLSAEEVLEIRSSDLRNKELAKHYRVSTGLISMIKNKKIWKHLHEGRGISGSY